MYTQIEFAVNVMIDHHLDMPANRHLLIADRYELGEKLSSTALGNVFHAHDFISAEEDEPLRQVIMFAVEPQIVAYPNFYDVMPKIIDEFSKKNSPLQVIGAHEDKGIYWIIIDETYQELLIKKLEKVRDANPTSAMDNLRPILLKTLDAVKQFRSKHDFGFIEPGAILCMDNTFKLINSPIALALRILAGINPDKKPTLALHSRYCSPQVAHGLLPTPQDDTFAIGCIAYHVLHGAPPFAELSTLEAYAQKKTPHSLTYLNPESHKSLQRALALERYERQPSPYELVHAFVSIPVENSADHSIYSAFILHTHRPATITVSLSLVLLLSLGVYQLYQQPEIFLTAPTSITTQNQDLLVTVKPTAESYVAEDNIITTATSPDSLQNKNIQPVETTPKPALNRPVTKPTPNAATLAANSYPKPVTQPVTKTTPPKIKASPSSPITEKPIITHITNSDAVVVAPKSTIASHIITTPSQKVRQNPQPAAVMVVPIAENTFVVGQKSPSTIATPPARKVKASPADSANEHVFIVVSDQ